MKKSLLYRLFRLGAIPRKLRTVLAVEGIEVADEGMRGWLIFKNVTGPKKRYLNRTEGFSGCLVITRHRILCYTFGRRQINISVDDPHIADLLAAVPRPGQLSLSFESGVMLPGWSGRMEFRFHTDKAGQFQDVLLSLGAQPGSPASE